MPTDAGTVTATEAPSGADALKDVATVVAVELDSAAEKLADSAGLAAVGVIGHQFLKRYTYSNSRPTKSWPVTQITGPVTNPYFRNASADQVLWWTVTLAPGSVLTCDHHTRQCDIDGDIHAVGAKPVVAGFWQMLPGDNILEIGGDAIYQGAIQVSLPNQALRS